MWRYNRIKEIGAGCVLVITGATGYGIAQFEREFITNDTDSISLLRREMSKSVIQTGLGKILDNQPMIKKGIERGKKLMGVFPDIYAAHKEEVKGSSR